MFVLVTNEAYKYFSDHYFLASIKITEYMGSYCDRKFNVFIQVFKTTLFHCKRLKFQLQR